ncbi:MAG: phage integrase SAM-like domain and Arm DNA-binding domain-containing protein [Flavobacteriales bacterium]|jgi:hypothetical protein|nr:phage integrase SAM-like domain and Arm DNA-binding domain-containing protein [Flavobacteriales bacterium]
MKNKFKIRTVVRKDKQKENGLVPIYFLVDLNGKVMKLSTGNWINLKDWDARRCEPKGNYANLRTKLRRDLTKIEDFYLDKIGRDEVVTAEMIKRFYKCGDENDFFAYYERFLELKRRTERESTVKSYTGTLNHLKKFRSNISINEIDLNFI